MKIGFSGTRHGMTGPQLDAFKALLGRLADAHPGVEFHHGDCVGADDQAATFANTLSTVATIVSHPPVVATQRAYNPWADRVEYPRPYFDRNRAIVAACDVLIAAPAEMANPLRGGTWHTLGVAEREGRPVWVCWPDGTVTEPKEARELIPPKGK
jgi:hypothetical protein